MTMDSTTKLFPRTPSSRWQERNFLDLGEYAFSSGQGDALTNVHFSIDRESIVFSITAQNPVTGYFAGHHFRMSESGAITVEVVDGKRLKTARPLSDFDEKSPVRKALMRGLAIVREEADGIPPAVARILKGEVRELKEAARAAIARQTESVRAIQDIKIWNANTLLSFDR